MTTEEDIKFWKEYYKALEIAAQLTKDRKKAYCADESILDFWINGPQDLVYELHKKVMRLRRQFKMGLTEKTKGSTVDSLNDELIDIINYSAFLKAFLEVRPIENTNGKD